MEHEIASLNNSIQQKTESIRYFAKAIHDNRMEAVPVLSQKLISILETLGMPNVRFKIEFKLASTYFENGKDEFQFLFSANKGTDFGLLKKVASGGEMSRIMLAVKAILAQYSKLPTLIFDEIDTGVSGEIANQNGRNYERNESRRCKFSPLPICHKLQQKEQHILKFLNQPLARIHNRN